LSLEGVVEQRLTDGAQQDEEAQIADVTRAPEQRGPRLLPGDFLRGRGPRRSGRERSGAARRSQEEGETAASEVQPGQDGEHAGESDGPCQSLGKDASQKASQGCTPG